MAKASQLMPISVVAGVQPSTDAPQASTQHYTYSKGIRFVQGIAEKIGGNFSLSFDYGNTIQGYVRSIFTEIINGKYYAIIGSHKKLYSLIGSRLTNITPFKSTSEAVANSLATQYGTLANNPFTTVIDSPVITVADADASRFIAGDTVYFSGCGNVGGISGATIDGDNIVRSVGVGSYTINVGTNATSSATGGGAGVTRSSGLIQVTDAAHGQGNGDRVSISGAADTGGVLAAEINNEFIIRNVATNTFDVMTLGNASSSVSSGGGASTIYYQEIPDGLIDETNAQGYGAGLYGVGLYGTALTSSSSRSFPRIWYSDRYADTIISTAGNQTGIYQWFGSADTAPEIVANAPTEVNYAFISNGILVTFGAEGYENRVFSSDQNDITNWTSSSVNQVFDDDIEGIGRLISHCPTQDFNLIFSENETYTMRYIGLPLVWEILPLDETVGVIGSMARASAKGFAYWMGYNNFYMYRGGKVEIIPANTQNESTCLRYVFDNLNWGQKSKIFAWYNSKYDEVWFHYPSATSMECDRCVRVNLRDYTWVIDDLDRTAAEYPAMKTRNPMMANIETLYKHEFGTDDDGAALEFTLRTPKIYNGDNTVLLLGIVPDSNQTGSLSFTQTSYLYPQSTTPVFVNANIITPTTEYVPIPNCSRYYQYEWTGNAIGQSWEMGIWREDKQLGAPK